MKKVILIMTLLIVGSSQLYADQLAYISKAEAESAAEYLKGKEVILYCGCCDNDTPEKIKVLTAEVVYTNYENYYEVVITFVRKGEIVRESVDLAYVWEKYENATRTIGSALGLKHEPCIEVIPWE